MSRILIVGGGASGMVASIYASKLVIENDKEVMKNLDNEDERQYAYKLFSETYKKLREEKTSK